MHDCFTVISSSSQIFFMICKWVHLKSIHFLSQHGWASSNNKPLLAAYLVCAAGPRSIPVKERWTRGRLGDSREVGLGVRVWHRTNQGEGVTGDLHLTWDCLLTHKHWKPDSCLLFICFWYESNSTRAYKHYILLDNFLALMESIGGWFLDCSLAFWTVISEPHILASRK